MNDGLKMSVVIPVYNMGGTIGEAIASVLNQTYQNFEIIVQDNDSQDNTAEMVRMFHDPRIRYFKNETNLGGARNFMEGWKNCQGDVLYYLAADDILAKYALQETNAAFLMDEKIGAVTRPYFWFQDDINKPVRITPSLRKDKDEMVFISDFEKASVAIHNEILGQVSGLAFRMKYLKENFFALEDKWIPHGYPFLHVFKDYPVVVLRKYQLAVRIGSSGIRIKKSSAYDISPTQRWIDMLESTLTHGKAKKFREYYIQKIIATNFIGLIQIRCYSRLRYFFREVWLLLKYKPANILDLKFWFFFLGCLIVPSSLLSRMVDGYKNNINSRRLGKVEFEYDLTRN